MAAKKPTGRTRAEPKKRKNAPKRFPREERSGADALGDASLVVEILAGWPPLSDAERAAFWSQFTDAQCERWSVQVSMADTRTAAIDWLVTLNAILRQFSPREYRPARLSFFAEQIMLLEQSQLQQKEPLAAQDDSFIHRAASLRARSMTASLAATLQRVAGGRETVRSQVAQAGKLPGASTRETVATLTSLIAVAEHELRNAPHVSSAMGLTAEVLDEAQAALETLQTVDEMREVQSIAGPDTQASRLAGRVLCELFLSWQSLRDARQRDERIPAVAPHANLVRLFELGDAVFGPDSDETPPVPTPTAA